MRLLIFATAILFHSQVTFAQLDTASELLLRPASANSPDGAGLESGRYKVKKPKSLPGKKVTGVETSSESALSAATSVVISPSTTSSTTTSTTSTTSTTTVPTVKKAKASKSEMENLLFSKPAPVVSAMTKPVDQAEVVETKPEIEEPSVSDQVRDMVMGTGQPIVEAYKEQIHPDDIRLNRIEVDFLPGVVSDNSKSSYSIRDYKSFSPKLQVGGHFWLTPFLGVYGDYTTTVGADVDGDAATQTKVLAHHEWTELGFDVRKFFGMSRKSNSLQFGIHLSEYKFNVPGDDTYRIKLRSSGVGLHLLTRIPVAPSYSWVFGGKLIPRVQHSEISTGIDASSGAGGESSRVDVKVGGEFKLARQNQIIWDVTSSFEKNQFSGQATFNDPATGLKPKSVSVSNTFLLFSLGYRWGQ